MLHRKSLKQQQKQLRRSNQTKRVHLIAFFCAFRMYPFFILPLFTEEKKTFRPLKTGVEKSLKKN